MIAEPMNEYLRSFTTTAVTIFLQSISLTSVICKLFERIVKEHMLDYLRKYNLITRHQHGFLSQHSTTTELVSY